jgi:hypothetical protein
MLSIADGSMVDLEDCLDGLSTNKSGGGTSNQNLQLIGYYDVEDT